jgi:YHS domain-containing protein
MSRSLALSFPWLCLLLFAVLVVWDNTRHGTVEILQSPESVAATDPGDQASDRLATDPICAMVVRTRNTHRVILGGQSSYFCSTYCRDEFKKDPQRWRLCWARSPFTVG